jgi:hypothetical protein
MKILEHNVETGEVIERNATAEEIAQIKSRKIEAETRELEAEAKAQAKAELLERLGITADEAKLLLA